MKKYKIITPAGNIYVESAREAQEYKYLYGYPYVRVNNENQDE